MNQDPHMRVGPCFLCTDAVDSPDFDYCRACGYGQPPNGEAPTCIDRYPNLPSTTPTEDDIQDMADTINARDALDEINRRIDAGTFNL